MNIFQDSDIFKILSEGISEGILIVNEQQTIVASNDKANTMFGYPSEGLNQKHISSIIP
ncbi:MAG: PAS domain-containing protein, partial [Croceitalea sp.]|nr:PAS domain-containing protein [Croceitalea sp.]